jgi:gamma-glutamyl-gamma-aminobutyrate hydrolase PuuD
MEYEILQCLKRDPGPPGKGKTAASTAIIEYCYVEKVPILVICGIKQGLNVVARRLSSIFSL